MEQKREIIEQKWEFTTAQKTIISLAILAEELVIKVTFGLFVPNWGNAIIFRLKRNNAIISERQ